MKLRNIIFCLVLIFCSLFMTSVRAETVLSSFTVRGSDVQTMVYGSNYLPTGTNSTLKFTYKVNSSGKVIFCTEIHDTMVSAGNSEVYTLTGNAGSQVAYIIENGYEKTSKSLKDYFITGVAIWLVVAPNDSSLQYFDVNAGTYKGASNDTTTRIASLVKASRTYSSATPRLVPNIPSTSLHSTAVDGYYISDPLSIGATVSISGYTATLSDAPAGTIIVDKNGKEKYTLASGEVFYVKVPESSVTSSVTKFNVNVRANVNVYTAYNYAAAVASHQNVAALYNETRELTGRLELTLNVVVSTTKSVSISKQDAVTGKELPGATLILKDSNGTEIARWESGTTPHKIENLPAGKYSFTELIAPDGYVKSSETATFEVKEDGSVVGQTVMKNYPNKLEGSVYISKRNATTGEELPGAKLVLTNESGEEVASWISGTTPHEIKNLPAGKYTLTELIAPDGYIKSSETVTFTVKEDGTTDGIVVMKNSPEEVPNNPQTGTIAIAIAWFVGIFALAYAYHYFMKIRKSNA